MNFIIKEKELEKAKELRKGKRMDLQDPVQEAQPL